MNDHFLIFTLQGRLCALPLAQVERVVQAVEVTPMTTYGDASAALGASSLRGVINVRGDIVPVFDLRPHSAAVPDDQMILVALPDGRRAALLCDRVETVRETPPQDMASARKLLPGTLGNAASGGILKDEAGLIHLQDIEALLTQSAGAVATLLELKAKA